MLEPNNDDLKPAQALIHTGYSLIQSVAKFAQVQKKRLQDVEINYRRTASEPQTLKHKRLRESRNLTRNLATSGWEKSALLRLPWEVRNIIWKEAVGGMIIHWFIENRRLRGMRCRSNNANCLLKCGVWLEKSSQTPWPIMGFIGMLLSCRQIYLEAIEFVYALNTFDTREVDVVAFLPDLLLSHSFQQIQRFNFHWTVRCPPSAITQSRLLDDPTKAKMRERDPSYKRSWFGVWSVISKMEQLEDLRVNIDINLRERSWLIEGLDIVKSITGPEKFRLVLPYPMAKSMTGKIGGPNVAVLCYLDEEY